MFLSGEGRGKGWNYCQYLCWLIFTTSAVYTPLPSPSHQTHPRHISYATLLNLYILSVVSTLAAIVRLIYPAGRFTDAIATFSFQPKSLNLCGQVYQTAESFFGRTRTILLVSECIVLKQRVTLNSDLILFV